MRREPSIEFLRLRDLGMHKRPDKEILEYASANGLLVVSHDVNTMPAAAYARLDDGKNFFGLILASQMKPIAALIDSLVLIWSASGAEDWENQVVFLPL